MSARWRDELYTHMNTKIIGHLSFLINCCLLPESACMVAAILNGVNWELGDTKYEWKGVENLYEFMHLTFYNYC